MGFEFMKVQGVPSEHPKGGACICQFKDGNLIDYLHPVKERRGRADAHLKIDAAGTKFLEYRFECAATSGDNRGMYLRLYTTGAGGGGDAARIYHEVVGVAAANAFGAHISLGFGESTVKGSITGLGVAMRATLSLPSASLAAGGHYAAIMAEVYSHGALANADAVGRISFIRCANDGHADGVTDLDDELFLFDIQGGTLDDAHLVADAVNEPSYAYNIRIRFGSTTMYLMCASDRT